jgi:hypothetical protein
MDAAAAFHSEAAAKVLSNAKRAFSDIAIVAGNHDVHDHGLNLGWRRRRTQFYERFNVNQSAESRYYPESGLNLLLVDSNHAAFAKGFVQGAAYDALVREASERLNSRGLSSSRTGPTQ